MNMRKKALFILGICMIYMSGCGEEPKEKVNLSVWTSKEDLQVVREMAGQFRDLYENQALATVSEDKEKIMAVADVFDALISKRCYKKSMSIDEAFGIIEKDMGSHFDPDVVETFLGLREEIENYIDR